MLNPRPIFGPSTIGKSLYDAAKKNDLGEVTHLLQIGKFNSLYTDKDGNNAFNHAALNGNTQMIILLVKKIRSKNYSYFISAASNGHTEIVNYLMGRYPSKKNEYFEYKDKNTQNALHHAAKNGHIETVISLLANGMKFSILGKDKFGNTALHYATLNGHIKTVKALISNTESPDIINLLNNEGKTPAMLAHENNHYQVTEFLNEKLMDFYGDSPLHRAIIENDFDSLKLLISNGEDVNVVNTNGMTPLHFAASVNATYVKYLLDKKARINAKDKWGFTPLYYSCDDQVIDILIDRGADIEKDPDGKTALYRATERGNNTLVAYLAKRGADIDPFTNSGNYPLRHACMTENLTMVQTLLDNGAKLIYIDSILGGSLLQDVVSEGLLEVVKLLVKHGANITKTDKYGNDPLTVALSYLKKIHEKEPSLVIPRELRQQADNSIKQLQDKNRNELNTYDKAKRIGKDTWQKMSTFLIKSLSDLKDTKLDFIKLLHFAVKHGELEVVKTLLDKGLDVNAQDEGGDTPLHISIENGQGDIFKALLEIKKTRIDQKNNNGNTPLILAITSYKLDYCGKLLRKGANPNLRDAQGNAPIHYALKKNSDEFASLLLFHGANVNATTKEPPLYMSLIRERIHLRYEELSAKKDDMILSSGANPNLIFSLTGSPDLTLLEKFISDTTDMDIATRLEKIKKLFTHGLKISSDLGIKISLDTTIPEPIKQLIEAKGDIQFKEIDEATDIKLTEMYKKAILQGNIILDPEKPLTISKVIPPSSFDNDIIGDKIVKAIKSITEEEWNKIKADPKEFGKIQKSGFATLIELSRILDKDGKNFVNNNSAIKTAINHPDDFIKFYKLFVQIMLTNKSIVEGLLTPKSSKASEIIEHSSPSVIETSNPKEDSSKFDTRAFSIPTLLLAFLSPEFKKELEVQDLMKENLDIIAVEAGSIVPNSLVKEDSQLRLIASLAEIISSQIKNHSSSKAVNTTPQEASLGLAGSGFVVSSSRGSSLPSRSDIPSPSALGGSASRLGESASSKRPNEGTAKNLDADANKKPRGSR